MALEKAIRTGNSTGFKFVNKGDTLKGYYLGTTVEPINGKDVDVHRFKNESGIFSVLGQADIKGQFKSNGVTAGMWVEITFSGEMQKLKGGRTMKLYDVLFNRDDLDSGESTGPSLEEDYGDEEDSYGEVAVAAPVAPAKAATAPSSDRQAAMRALLNRNRSA